MNSARLKFLLRALISLGLIWFVLHKLDWHEVGARLQKANLLWVVTGSFLTLPMIVLLAARWRIFLRRHFIPLPFSTIFPLTWSGQFFNSVLPGSTGGDFVKIYQLCRLHPERKAHGAVTVIVDRFTAFVALVTMAAIAFLFRPISWTDIAGGTPFGNPAWPAVGALVGLLIGAFGLLLLRRSEGWMVRIKKLFTVLKSGFSPDATLGAGVALAVCIHLLNFLIVFCFARALGIQITYPQILLFMPVLLLLVMVPVTVNGHGLREILLIFYFCKLGLTVHDGRLFNKETAVDLAIALSALMVANDLLWSLPGGLWYLARFKTKHV